MYKNKFKRLIFFKARKRKTKKQNNQTTESQMDDMLSYTRGLGWLSAFHLLTAVVIAATIYKYGVAIAIIGQLMLILAPVGPHSSCADAGHMPRGTLLFLAPDVLSSIHGPNWPWHSVSIFLAACSSFWVIFSSTAADRHCVAHDIFFSLALGF